MSVVIIGGHDRMVSQYKKICKNYNCKAKVFTQMSASLDKTGSFSSVHQYRFPQDDPLRFRRGQ
mgnify:CR=1 FL=1